MTNTTKKQQEPLLRIAKRTDITIKKKILIYAIGLVGGLLLASIICSLFSKYNDTPIDFFLKLFEGAFGTKNNILDLIRDTALLLGVCLALVPAFKMKFWNLGGNGQILIGSLVSIIIMYELGGKVADPVINILTLVASILAGGIWAAIPGVCKALFNTNESLFTLMMNYIAAGLVTTYICATVKTQSGTFPTLEHGTLPVLGNKIVLTVLIVAMLTVGMYFYLNKTKHGFELALVGESQNTAKYVGINTKKVVIRTIVLSGALCGLIGMLLVTAVTPSITADTARNYGFTGIMAAWLGGFNPIIMVFSSFFIIFVNRGMRGVQIGFHFSSNAIVNVVLGLVYFAIIACAFFVNYRVIFRKKSKKEIQNEVKEEKIDSVEEKVKEEE